MISQHRKKKEKNPAATLRGASLAESKGTKALVTKMGAKVFTSSSLRMSSLLGSLPRGARTRNAGTQCTGDHTQERRKEERTGREREREREKGKQRKERKRERE